MATATEADDRFSQLVQCVGFSAADLTEDQRAKLEAQIECFEDGELLAVKCFSNLDTTSDEDMPSGTVSIFSMDATVTPDAIPDTMFGLMAVSKIHLRDDMPDGYTDAYFQDADKQAAVNEAVPQYSKAPPKLSLRSAAKRREYDTWDSELGGPESLISVMSATRENGRDKDYYLVARGTAPLAVEEFKAELRSKKPTFRSLLSDGEWRTKLTYLHALAERNVTVNMYAAAEALGVPVTPSDDLAGYRKNEHQAYRSKAEPEWTQQVSSIVPIQWNNQRAAAVFHGVVPREDCYRLADQRFFVLGSPYDGVSIFTISDQIKSLGMPTVTGRRAPASELPEVETKIAESRARGVMWEGRKKSSPMHTDLHPEAFHPVTARFKHTMKTGGGWNAEHHLERWIPVMLKLWNPELKRP